MTGTQADWELSRHHTGGCGSTLAAPSELSSSPPVPAPGTPPLSGTVGEEGTHGTWQHSRMGWDAWATLIYAARQVGNAYLHSKIDGQCLSCLSTQQERWAMPIYNYTARKMGNAYLHSKTDTFAGIENSCWGWPWFLGCWVAHTLFTSSQKRTSPKS